MRQGRAVHKISCPIPTYVHGGTTTNACPENGDGACEAGLDSAVIAVPDHVVAHCRLGLKSWVCISTCVSLPVASVLAAQAEVPS